MPGQITHSSLDSTESFHKKTDMHIQTVLDTSELSGPVHDKNIDLFNEKQKEVKQTLYTVYNSTHTHWFLKEGISSW